MRNLAAAWLSFVLVACVWAGLALAVWLGVVAWTHLGPATFALIAGGVAVALTVWAYNEVFNK